MTSNAGSREMSASTLGFGASETSGEDAKKKLAKTHGKEAIERLFSPEFLNRLDAIVAEAYARQGVARPPRPEH